MRLWQLRAFEAGGEGYALCVDVETLRTFVVREDDLWRGTTEEKERGPFAGSPFLPLSDSGDGGQGTSPYERALERYAYVPMTGKEQEGVVMTVDLCPSHRRWDRDLFEALREMRTEDRPLPVAVCISGAWVRRHGPAFAQLCAWDREGELDLTFVNHSDTHPVGARGDFLNNEGVDFEGEILNAEVTLLAHGVVPSPFFRFPGLVHSAARLKALMQYGLIPVDADEWPGQGDIPTDRVPEGILLVHGNGNERAGVRWFLEMARQTGLRERLRDGQLKVFSLTDYAGEESGRGMPRPYLAAVFSCRARRSPACVRTLRMAVPTSAISCSPRGGWTFSSMFPSAMAASATGQTPFP